ncbi:MAG: TonB-dependent receptor, partial [Flavobacterium sp.]|nr:TonB-dependent receptor [Flavobacterium sp.]
YGSFNTRKHTVKFSSGLMNDHFELAGRLSNIASDGFIDRATSDLKSYFLQGTFVKGNTLIKALAFGGTEKTYQAWNGVEDLDKLNNDRTYNPAGEYIDDQGNIRYYDNETDNYQQDHYQLHWNQRLNNRWSTNLALHYTKGTGYYENYKVGEDVSDYGLEPSTIDGELIDETDLVRQKWLDNDFWGTTFSANYKGEKMDIVLGGGMNKYEGSHFGNVLWTRSVILPENNFRYYNDNSVKTDVNFFAKVNYEITTKFSVFADMQYRNAAFSANGNETGIVDDNFNFFNPKAGLTFIASDRSNIYFSYAKANREPNRNDYESGNPRPEQLNDFELGWRYTAPKTRLNINGYYMRYKDQLVLTGELNDVGAPLRENVGNSYRLGVEIDASVQINDKWVLRPNMTVSTNKNEDFVFERDGVLQNLGDTNIAFSPNVIVGNIVTFMPISNLQMSLLTKFVGEQYMGNIDSPNSKLEAYSVTDFNVMFEIRPKSIFDSIIFSGLVNNVFNLKYESNGYFYTYDDNWSSPTTITTIEGAGYYPQAGINFLTGVTLKF